MASEVEEDEFKVQRKLERVVDAHDPLRCGGVGTASGDQCWFRVMPGTKNCILHGGSAIQAILRRKAKKLYEITKYRAKLDRLEGEGLEVASRLTEELAILRMSLEAMVARGDEVEFSQNSSRIALLVREIRETLKVDQGQRRALGDVLDKVALAKLCDAIVSVMLKHVSADALPKVVDDVAQCLADAISGGSSE